MILDISGLINKFGINITGVIHVGAHFGEEDRLYRSLGVNKIHYFEPVKKTFEILKRNVIEGENIFLHNCAIGSEQKMNLSMWKIRINLVLLRSLNLRQN